MNKKNSISPSITLALPAGRMSTGLFAAVNEIVQRHGLAVYLTTMQNLRIVDIAENALEAIRDEFAEAGAVIKKAGQFPLPRVCAGRPYCKLAVADPTALSAKILERLGNRTDIKPKLKLAIAGCPANCSNALLTDIGIVATKSGYDIYVGGKGGTTPRKGSRIIRRADADKVVEVIEQLIAFHALKTTKKKRMCKLMQEPDFPFPVIG